MTTTVCPKCRHMRPVDTQAPAWQCPGCGVAYAKAGLTTEPRAALRSTDTSSASTGLPWRALLTVMAVCAGQWWGHQAELHKRDFGALFSRAGDMDEAGVRKLAATVRPGQITMYTTTECGHCTVARDWLTEHGFAFNECNMSRDRRCEEQFRTLGATGTPYLIVRGPRGEHHMKEGFGTDEFFAALKG